MLMVRIFYVEKKTKQICYRQNRAELLACIIVNQDQDVWCFCLQCAMSFSSLSSAGSTQWLSMPTYGTFVCEHSSLFSLSFTENVIKAYLHRAWDRIKEFRRVSVYNLVLCPGPVQK